MSQPRGDRPCVLAPCCELLEDRRLLSAGSATLAAGLLSVEGTRGDDRISVSYRVGKNGQIRVDVRFDARVVANVRAASVRRIVIRGGEGDDVIRVAHGTPHEPAASFGPLPDRNLDRCDKPATLFGNGGDDVLEGGSGDDRLEGGGGSDILFGGEGDDFIAGQGGDDQLTGENGRDTLDGGTGRDRLRGDPPGPSEIRAYYGDDDAVDRLVGGAGGDSFDTDDRAGEVADFTDVDVRRSEFLSFV